MSKAALALAAAAICLAFGVGCEKTIHDVEAADVPRAHAAPAAADA